ARAVMCTLHAVTPGRRQIRASGGCSRQSADAGGVRQPSGSAAIRGSAAWSVCRVLTPTHLPADMCPGGTGWNASSRGNEDTGGAHDNQEVAVRRGHGGGGVHRARAEHSAPSGAVVSRRGRRPTSGRGSRRDGSWFDCAVTTRRPARGVRWGRLSQEGRAQNVVVGSATGRG